MLEVDRILKLNVVLEGSMLDVGDGVELDWLEEDGTRLEEVDVRLEERRRELDKDGARLEEVKRPEGGDSRLEDDLGGFKGDDGVEDEEELAMELEELELGLGVRLGLELGLQVVTSMFEFPQLTAAVAEIQPPEMQ